MDKELFIERAMAALFAPVELEPDDYKDALETIVLRLDNELDRLNGNEDGEPEEEAAPQDEEDGA